MAGAGGGTEGGTIFFGVKENNYLGRGLSVDANASLSAETFKGKLTVLNPNYKDSDKSTFFNVQAIEIDQLKNFGYKTNRTGFEFGTGFEYLEDFNLNLSTSTFVEKIETDSTASTRQKSQAGNYLDTFAKFNFDLDKRNQKFKTSDSAILLPLTFYFIIQGSFLLIFFTIMCFIVACFEWHMMSKKKSYYIYGFLFLIFSFYTFYKLSIELIDVFYVIMICSSTDIGGYIFGKLFKGPKLTKISPKKTYAGMIGGYAFSLISLSVIINFIDYETTSILFLLTIIISTVSQLGDIIISYFKRLSKIKNTGKLIPGHGGLLDRIDGMIFAFPIYYLINLNGYLNI